MALFANSRHCNAVSAAEGRPSVADKLSRQLPVTQSGSGRHGGAEMQMRGRQEAFREHLRALYWLARDISSETS